MKRFRPLAGFWFLKVQDADGTFLKYTFPSPCGVLVLKRHRHRALQSPMG